MSDSSFAPALPFDVLTLIIEVFAFLPNGRGLKVLSSMSRTCKTLQSVCQRYIFSTINLRPRICDWSYTPRARPENEYEVPSIAFVKLQRVLEQNPTLAGYVRTLYYHSHESNCVGDDGEGATQLLDKFTGLQKLVLLRYLDVNDFDREEEEVPDEEKFDDTSPSHLPMNWNKLPHTIQDAFSRLISRVTYFEFKHIIKFPLDIFLSCSNLQSLDISHSRLSPLSLDISVHNPSIRLDELRLAPGTKSNIEILRSLRPDGLPVFDFAHIKRISFAPDSGQLEDVLQGTELESLHITSRDWYGPHLPNLHAQPLEGLRELSLTHTPYNHSNPSVSRLLPFQLIQGANSLERLEKITVSLNTYPGPDDGRVEDVLKDLKQLDRHLSDPEHFPVLKSVSVTVSIIPCHTPKTRHWDYVPDTHLLRLKHSIPHFNYSVRSAWQ